MAQFEPGLLDKLLDASSSPAATRRRLSLEDVKRAVAEDVEALLNTRAVLAADTLAGLPQCQRSLLSFGVQDFSGLSLASHQDRRFICQSIQQAIEWHEPRLRRVKVTLEAHERSVNALRFSIEALLVVDTAEEPVDFDAMLQPSTLQYSVAQVLR
jgi:type VI secretion system protein ImpF